MKKTGQLLELIATGNPVDILAEENLVSRIDFLLENDLICIEGDKMYLTEKGQKIRKIGLQKYLEDNSDDLIYAKKPKPEEKKEDDLVLIAVVASILFISGLLIILL